jgi:hypothetical protein
MRTQTQLEAFRRNSPPTQTLHTVAEPASSSSLRLPSSASVDGPSASSLQLQLQSDLAQQLSAARDELQTVTGQLQSAQSQHREEVHRMQALFETERYAWQQEQQQQQQQASSSSADQSAVVGELQQQLQHQRQQHTDLQEQLDAMQEQWKVQQSTWQAERDRTQQESLAELHRVLELYHTEKERALVLDAQLQHSSNSSRDRTHRLHELEASNAELTKVAFFSQRRGSKSLRECCIDVLYCLHRLLCCELCRDACGSAIHTEFVTLIVVRADLHSRHVCTSVRTAGEASHE